MPRKQFPRSLPFPSRRKGAHTVVHRQGYLLEYCPEHPACNTIGMVLQHRLVMEVALGRFLTGVEVVHHKNNRPADNRIANLELFESKSAHMRFHKRTSTRRDPAVIQRVREAAADPRRSMKSVGISPTTVDLICKEQGIRWVSAAVRVLDEDSVREALRGATILEAAARLNVGPQTLYNHWAHLWRPSGARRRHRGQGD